MCEQTEINYLDGDVVWVKLGACWWPGQVTGFQNLSEDLKAEFQKKPLIAAVKFFQEDTYEFVKNYQQIYKYNCTLKDDFIKKGLDKYRSKSKDGSSYMDKFPSDVEMAEKLTGGDPDILRQDKFCPEEKPDIAALFGEKRIPKKRRDREDGHRRSDSDVARRITHPRFARGESDHEVRIRQQPSSLPSTPTNAGSPHVYSCHLCSFTSSRVNVLICHTKSHKSRGPNESYSLSPSGPQSRTYSRTHSAGGISVPGTPRRKYAKKEKSQSTTTTSSSSGSRKRSESGGEESASKRKSGPKHGEKSAGKKKKIDPELKEKLLADWDDELEDDEDTNGTAMNTTGSLNSSLNSSPVKSAPTSILDGKRNDDDEKEENAKARNHEIITETENFLKETEELSSIRKIRESLDHLRGSSKKSAGGSSETKKSPTRKDASGSESENKNASDKDDKKSRLACFDFDEDDLSEPSMPVRKIPRVFGEKSLSLKKEIIKEFEMSQAMKNEIRRDTERIPEFGRSMDLKAHEIIEIIGTDPPRERQDEAGANVEKKKKLDDEIASPDKAKRAEAEKRDNKRGVVARSTGSGDDRHGKSNTCEVEIVEIFEVEREDGDDGSRAAKAVPEKEAAASSPGALARSDDKTATRSKDETPVSGDNKSLGSRADSEDAIAESNYASAKETEDTMSERCTTETEEDETVSEETVVEQSENSDVDTPRLAASRAGQTLKKRGRGRPRKNARSIGAGDAAAAATASPKKSPKTRVSRGNKRFRMSEKFELERKTSDSDTDRSYSGRRRKPNKKYLESDIYVSDPDHKAFRTDESQSESETTKEKTVARPKRGRRPRANVDRSSKSSGELVVQMDKREIEVSYQTDGENNVSSIDIKQGASESGVVARTFIEKEEEATEDTERDAAFGGSAGTDESRNESRAADTKASEATTLETANKIVEPHADETLDEKASEKEDPFKRDKDVSDREKSPIKTQTGDKTGADKVETPRETTKINMDKLPPKKSQIKKFELSQIESLDADAQATEAKPEPESKVTETKSEPESNVTDAKPELKVTEETKPEPESQITEEAKPEPENQVTEPKLEPESIVTEPKPDPENQVTEPKPEPENQVTELKLEPENQVTEEAKLEPESKVTEAKPEPESKVTEEAKSEPKVEPQPEVEAEPASEAEKDAQINTGDQSELKTAIEVTDEIENAPKTEEARVESREIPKKPTEEKRETEEESVEEASKTKAPNRSPVKSPTKSPSAPAQAGEATKNAPRSPTKASEQVGVPKKSSMQTRYKGRFTPETGKGRRDLFAEEKPTNTFQEAFLKTLEMDKKTLAASSAEKGRREKRAAKKKAEDTDVAGVLAAPPAKSTKLDESGKDTNVSEAVQPEGNTSIGIENMEVVVEENVEIDAKIGDNVFTAEQLGASSEFVVAKTSLQLDTAVFSEESAKSEEKSDELGQQSSAALSSSDISMPVKKREMPRIIENVTLTEPVQILKTKLLDSKTTPSQQKGIKHKLDTDGSATRKGEQQKGGTRAKMMKIDASSANSKIKAVRSQLPLAKKLQVLKAEEMGTLLDAAQSKEQQSVAVATTPATTIVTTTPSSQSLVDMEFDINSMPFVLSDDMLTAEQIEQMPVVISSIIPASSSSIPSTLTLTPTTQMVSPVQTTQFKIVSETATPATEPPSPSPKKKSGMPAILKSKSKPKPTVANVKTIAVPQPPPPPLTGGVKSLKFQSSPVGKTTPVLAQKSPTPGKYVLVQTASGQQQLRQVVTSKSATPQKVILPPGISKTITSGAQLIQQGGKVVILTSGQSQAKVVNISKTLSGKMQKIVTSKGQQLLCPIGPQGGIITSKAPKVIAPKADVAGGSSTTSKLVAGQKIIGTTFTPITDTVAKLGTLSSGIITKGGVLTPITGTLSGKTIITSKALVTTKGGTTILSAQGQSLGATKTILTPVSQAIAGKTTILGTSTIVGSKGTILMPISGQQMKTIVTKSPAKGGKVQYQQVQQKVQILQKSPKSAAGTSQAAMRAASSGAKSSGGTLILQSASSSPAATATGLQKSGSTPLSKKIVKQQTVAVQNVVSPSGATIHQPTVTMMQQVQPKGKLVTTQKVIIPRSGGRQTKAQQQQQKLVAQKAQETSSPTVQSILPKTVAATSVNVSTTPASKTVAQSRQQAAHATKSPAKTPTKAQKNLLSLAVNSAVSAAATTASVATNVPLPPLEPIDADKKTRTSAAQTQADTIQKKLVEKQPQATEKSADVGAEKKPEETKVVAQPQIMALPTESSDGTQTYVLVTIDEQGQIQPLDNNALMSLEGTTQNPDGTRTLYIDPSSLGETGTLDNIVLQFDNGILPNMQTTNVTEPGQTAIMSESFPASEVIQTGSNQDILAAALANTDFQQEIGLTESQAAAGSVMTQTGLTQTSLINQTILQSTIIPPTEPISSPSVLETSLTLNQPIMTPLEVPSNVSIQSKDTTAAVAAASTSVVPVIPSSLELPITITNPSISYISTAGGEAAQIQIPGNSMPDIAEIMEGPGGAVASAARVERAEISGAQFLVIPNLEETQSVQQAAEIAIAPSATAAPAYTVTVSNNVVLENPQVQTTPSMPIIDDAYADASSQFAAATVAATAGDQQQAYADVSEMLVVSKAPAESAQLDVTVTSEMTVTSPREKSNNETTTGDNVDNNEQQVFSSQEVPITSEELILQQPAAKESSAEPQSGATPTESATREVDDESNADDGKSEAALATSLPIIDESHALVRSESAEQVSLDATDSSSELKTVEPPHEADATTDKLKQLTFSEGPDDQAKQQQQQQQQRQQVTSDATMEVDDAEPSSQEESDRLRLRHSMELDFADEEVVATNTETSQEVPSQSQYEQFDSRANDSMDVPSQSAASKSESASSVEATQSIAYEPMEVDDDDDDDVGGTAVTEPPTQSFEHSKSEASQSSSCEASAETNVNAPTQSFNAEIAQSEAEERPARCTDDEAIDDQSFPTQSYEVVDKVENATDNLETDAEISQEGNIPSQSNDIGADGIGTSSVSTNNSGLNEDETASSSYVPETPENQERDQDQESAISTSSYEIPPCEELNIASSSVNPDTSAMSGGEHASGVRDENGVPPEIPTSSSYNLNPDITSTHHVDSVPSSSYEDRVIIEQNVSTSYEVPISMPGLEDTCSQNFVPESTDQRRRHRNEPSSYYAHHQEVTESYYESVDQDGSNSRLEADPREDEHVTPGGYYEANPQEVSQSYFTPAEETTTTGGYSGQTGVISPGDYYDPNRPESEASQSYYAADDLDGKTEQSSTSPNIEASQSFYQESSTGSELRLRQRGEATPTYSEGYPADYTLESSPIERHDLVESSVPATRSMDR